MLTWNDVVAKLAVIPSGCWEWQGTRTHAGYGIRNTALIHRVAFGLVRRPLVDDEFIDHLCRNRACANPWHLDAVTNRENVQRGRGSRLWPKCKRDRHRRTEANTISRPSGHVTCRDCKKEAEARAYRRRQAAQGKTVVPFSELRKRCRRGHARTEQNTHINSRGDTVCRDCVRAAEGRRHR